MTLLQTCHYQRSYQAERKSDEATSQWIAGSEANRAGDAERGSAVM
jgi:hypothetical protein